MSNQIMISLNTIRKHSPCVDGWETLLRAQGKTKADDELFPVSSILDSNDLEDTLWVLRCLPDYDSLWRKFAWWCANQVIDNTDDPRVKDCLDIVWRYSNGDVSDEELSAVASATRSVVASASEAASEVRSAASLAASLAAWSVAWSATRSAASAVSSAARSAVESAVESASASAVESASASAVWLATASAVWLATRPAARSAQENKLKELLDMGEWVD